MKRILFLIILFFSTTSLISFNYQSGNITTKDLFDLLEGSQEVRQVSLLGKGWDLHQNSDTHEMWNFSNRAFNGNDAIYIALYEGKNFKDIFYHFDEKELFTKFKNEITQFDLKYMYTNNDTYTDYKTKKILSRTKSVYKNEKYNCEFTIQLGSTDPERIASYTIKLSKIF